MPLPKGYIVRKGDEVLVRVRAKRDERPEDPGIENHFEIVGRERHSFFMDSAEVHALYCRKWSDGDRVRGIGDPEIGGEVIASCDEFVWVKVTKGENEGSMLTFVANELEAEPEEIAVEPVVKTKYASLEPLTPFPEAAERETVT
jgi:hypothetical protein